VLDDGEVIQDVQLHRIDGGVEDVGILDLPDSIHQLHRGRLPVLLIDLGLDGRVAVKQLGVQDNLSKLRKLLAELFEIGLSHILAFEIGIGELDFVGDPHFFRGAGFFSLGDGLVGISETGILLALGDSLNWLRP
jgi:hypothetical protein